MSKEQTLANIVQIAYWNTMSKQKKTVWKKQVEYFRLARDKK